MDIDKIQFGQLSSTGKIDKSFEDLDVNNDGKINEQDENLATNPEIKNAISQILSSDVDEEPELDENADFDIDNISPRPMGEGQSEGATPQADTAQIATLSLQVQQLQKEQEDLQDELEDKQKEQAKIEKEILAKQEEYENLAKEIENSEEKDPSKIARAEELGAEIKSLTTDFENLKSEITEIQGKSKNNSTQLQMLNTQIQSLQSQTSQEVSQTNMVNNISEVGEVSDVAEVNEATPTNAPTPTNKVEIKTMEEYVADINCKFDELWDKFGGDRDKITEYMNNNLGKFMDATGDGKVDKIDYVIWNNYMKVYGTSGGKFQEEWKTDKDKVYTKSRYFAQQIKTRVYHNCYLNDCNSYDLDDVTNMIKLGADTNILAMAKRNLNINKIAQDEDWEAKLDTYCASAKLNWLEIKTLKEQISKTAEWAKNNPEHAAMAGLASIYSEYANNMAKQKDNNEAAAQADYEHSQLMYEEYLKDPEIKASYQKNKKLHTSPYTGWIDDDRYKSFENYCATLSNKNESVSENIAKRNKSIFESATNIHNITKMFDLNIDGVIDSNDLSVLSTDVDLDGDGTVNSEEKTFLNEVKKQLSKKIWENTATKGYSNNNNIDNVIDYLDNFPQSAVKDIENEALGLLHTRYEHNRHNDINWFGFLPDDFDANMIRRKYEALGTLFVMGAGNMSYLGKIPREDIAKLTEDETAELIKNAVKDAQPANTYLKYIKNADLSKEELQEILNKINNASEYAQSQLAEVKSVVEQRIASM